MARRIAAINFKGGVGKTTAVINLSHALVLAGYRVLIIDTDKQCNSTSTLVEQVDSRQLTLYDALFGAAPLKDCLLHTRTGIDLIPGDTRLDQADQMLVIKPGRERVLRKLVDQLLQEVDYDFVFFDNNPAWSMLTQNSVVGADEMLIPLNLEGYSMDGVRSMVREVTTFCEDIGHTTKIGGVLPIGVDKRFDSTNVEYLNQLRGFFGSLLLESVRTDRSINKSQMMHLSVFEYDDKSKGAEDFRSLANYFTVDMSKKTVVK